MAKTTNLENFIKKYRKFANRQQKSEDKLLGEEFLESLKKEPFVDTIKKYKEFTDEQLKDQTVKLRLRLQSGETLEDIKEDAFAIAYEAERRVTGKVLRPSQFEGALGLSKGYAVEMDTGEGKTDMSVAAIYLKALTGKGVHVVLSNDYLVSRDGGDDEQRPKVKDENNNEKIEANPRDVLKFLGLEVGCVLSDMKSGGEERKAAYAADVTYATIKEIGFDYLRDRMAMRREQQVMPRGLNSFVGDELDAIMLDEGNTPMVISTGGQSQADEELFVKAADFVKKWAYSVWEEETHKGFMEAIEQQQEEAKRVFFFDKEEDSVAITKFGWEKIMEHLKLNPNQLDDFFAKGAGDIVAGYFHNAAHVHFCLHNEIDYRVVESEKGEREVVLTSPTTKRDMPGQKLRDGLHQALEAKEGAKISPISNDVASITVRSLVEKYPDRSGMSGTLLTETEELGKTFNGVGRVERQNDPQKKKIKTHTPVVFAGLEGKYMAIVEQTLKCHKKGQPILIGTDSIVETEAIEKCLVAAGLKPAVLNAKNAALEASIVEQAGRKGAITIATDMAGRGTDIKLEEGVDSREIGGLFVLETALHESQRTDNQLKGRAGRQGAWGEIMQIFSLDDNIVGESTKLRSWATEYLEQNPNRFALVESEKALELMREAQKNIESNQRGGRESLQKQEDPIRCQRETFYGYREEILNQQLKTSKMRLIDNQIKALKEARPKGRFAKWLNKRAIAKLEKEKKTKHERPYSMKEVLLRSVEKRTQEVFSATRMIKVRKLRLAKNVGGAKGFTYRVFTAIRPSKRRQPKPINNIGEVAEFVYEVFGGSKAQIREFFADTFGEGWLSENIGDIAEMAKSKGKPIDINYGDETTQSKLNEANITAENLGKKVKEWVERTYERDAYVYGEAAAKETIANALLRSADCRWEEHLEEIENQRSVMWANSMMQKDANQEFAYTTSMSFGQRIEGLGNDLLREHGAEKTETENIAFRLKGLPPSERAKFHEQVERRREEFKQRMQPRQPVNLTHVKQPVVAEQAIKRGPM